MLIIVTIKELAFLPHLNATVMQLKSEILKNTKSHCMKMSNFLVLIELIKLTQRDHLENLMQESYTLANIAAMNLLKRESLKDTKSLYMKDSNTKQSLQL